MFKTTIASNRNAYLHCVYNIITVTKISMSCYFSYYINSYIHLTSLQCANMDYFTYFVDLATNMQQLIFCATL